MEATLMKKKNDKKRRNKNYRLKAKKENLKCTQKNVTYYKSHRNSICEIQRAKYKINAYSICQQRKHQYKMNAESICKQRKFHYDMTTDSIL